MTAPPEADRAWVRRAAEVLRPDPGRVITKLLLPGREIAAGGSPGGVIEDLLLPGQAMPLVPSRAGALIDRVLAMPEQLVASTLAATQRRYSGRHFDLPATFARNFAAVADRLPEGIDVSASRRDLIGAYCTQEVSVESAALFNPSVVIHPDQNGLGADEVRFVMSVRAVGEGHISSIEFRTGVLSGADGVRIDDPGRYLVTGSATLGDDQGSDAGSDTYRLDFPPDRPLSERVLYPVEPNESHGMEDARFIRFCADDGTSTYYATYTAFDGSHIASRRLQTDDFRAFRSSPLLGPGARNKGMALFPRRVRGDYVALSRWDGQSIGVSRSADGLSWGPALSVQVPQRPWELIQVGNCGSPIETAEGWLVLTHGVGPMRTYQIGAMLLDLDRPERVIGALSEPVLGPTEDERDGYVPNVVYSCGTLLHGRTLFLPYGCSDSAIRFAFIDIAELLSRIHTSR